jgi:hypothetical protein
MVFHLRSGTVNQGLTNEVYLYCMLSIGKNKQVNYIRE